MALCGIGFTPTSKRVEVWYLRGNSVTKLPGRSSMCRQPKIVNYFRGNSMRVICLSSVGNAQSASIDSLEEESGHVIRFKKSDFKMIDRASVGLGGRTDEVIFEAIVKDPNSHLYNTRVVLRQLISVQAQRRGKRAIEVLKRLAHRKLLYHYYSMQVHGYISSPSDAQNSFVLVHGYHGSFSLRHWLQQSNWLPTLEATLALDEESVKKVGDDSVGGPAVSRQLRITRILMRDLLIGVNYLHSHGLAHTELRLENVHISPVDRHIKVGILGNASDFYEDGANSRKADNSLDRRKMMIAFDISSHMLQRCVGFIMAKMVLRELMDPVIFMRFKSFLNKGNDPSCLREFLLSILSRNSPQGNIGLQMLDRNWGAGWNLLSLLLATKPSKRISCLDALRHPFLCGPRWRVAPSMNGILWGLGSTTVRIAEEYIYHQPQRNRLAYFIELMEMLNPHSRPRSWLELLPGKWRLLYCTGRHIGLTLRQPPARVLIGAVNLTVSRPTKPNANLAFESDIGFTVIIGQEWPHNKNGMTGKMNVNTSFRVTSGRRLYLKEVGKFSFGQSSNMDSLAQKLSGKKWRKVVPFKEFPSSLPVARLVSGDIELTMSLGDQLNQNIVTLENIVQEIRTQVPTEIFDLSKLVCGTYVDSRLLVLRGVSGSALLFTRSLCG
ncbi:hypothetical protein K2173_026758 [Erythroxylum novogranatense]|uniref:Protein kinase domain-containing protein n=1 Tax=Erythroxylum novogranatense TaxID=1862640 RepID=A0AAV8TX42_9ROSI|nr:hypothetical protein K2173_026758 [Erythroxylum novogranatense]